MEDEALLLEEESPDGNVIARVDATGGGADFYLFQSPSALDEKIAQSRAYWDAWDDDPSPWERYQDSAVDVLRRLFRRESNYYAIDGGRWPPKALFRFDHEGASIFCTSGVGLRAQPAVESYTDNPSRYRRIELGMAIHGSNTDPRSIGGFLSGQAAFPW